jgi:hypothetical protein
MKIEEKQKNNTCADNARFEARNFPKMDSYAAQDYLCRLLATECFELAEQEAFKRYRGKEGIILSRLRSPLPLSLDMAF